MAQLWKLLLWYFSLLCMCIPRWQQWQCPTFREGRMSALKQHNFLSLPWDLAGEVEGKKWWKWVIHKTSFKSPFMAQCKEMCSLWKLKKGSWINVQCIVILWCFALWCLIQRKKLLISPAKLFNFWWPTISTSTWNSFPKVYIQIQSKRILRMPCQKSQTLWPAFHLSFPPWTLFLTTGFHCQEGRRLLGWARGLSVLRSFLHRKLSHQISFLHN